jgi:hypothetical protein
MSLMCPISYNLVCDEIRLTAALSHKRERTLRLFAPIATNVRLSNENNQQVYVLYELR